MLFEWAHSKKALADFQQKWLFYIPRNNFYYCATHDAMMKIMRHQEEWRPTSLLKTQVPRRLYVLARAKINNALSCTTLSTFYK